MHAKRDPTLRCEVEIGVSVRVCQNPQASKSNETIKHYSTTLVFRLYGSLFNFSPCQGSLKVSELIKMETDLPFHCKQFHFGGKSLEFSWESTNAICVSAHTISPLTNMERPQLFCVHTLIFHDFSLYHLQLVVAKCHLGAFLRQHGNIVIRQVAAKLFADKVYQKFLGESLHLPPLHGVNAGILDFNLFQIGIFVE